MQINEFQEKVRKLSGKIDIIMDMEWDGFQIFIDMVEEVGEIAEVIKCIEGLKKKKTYGKKELAKEMADVLYSLCNVANYYGVDLEKAVEKMLHEYEDRISKKEF